jgi:tetratricopeptide (TPR) repeat protein
LELAAAQEISEVGEGMQKVDFFVDENAFLLDNLLELEVGERSDYALAEVRGYVGLGTAFLILGVFPLAQSYLRRGLSQADQIGDPRAIGYAYLAHGLLDFWRGRWDECLHMFRRSAAAHREVGDLHFGAVPTMFSALCVLYKGDVSHAATLASELQQVGRDCNDPQIDCWAAIALGSLQLMRGALDEAEGTIRKGLNASIRISDAREQTWLMGLLGKCLLQQGRIDNAMSILSEGIAVIEQKRLRGTPECAEALTGMAEACLVALERSDRASRPHALRNARTACRHALLSARRTLAWMPQAMRLYGTLAWESGNPSAAQHRWRHSLVLAEQWRFPVQHALTLLEMGRKMEDGALLDEANEALSRLEAKVPLASDRCEP